VTVEELHWWGRSWIEEHLEDFSEAFRLEMERGLRTTIDAYMAARHRRFDYALDLDRVLGEDAVLVCPAHGYAGWLADGPLPGTGKPAGSEGYNMGEFNLSGHPSLALPAGVASNGVPFGILVNGPRWRDDLVLAFGAAWEGIRPWPAVAPGYAPFAAP
jgi:Asp-tRNA(Asn)/Glu-tRNA(Gln) amidotransferase A subunit family amidase